MSLYDNIANTFSNIANAIRIRTGSSNTYTPEQMPTAINAITEPPEQYCVRVDGVKRWGSIRVPDYQTSYRPVVIGNNVTYCVNMFANCINFNQPVTISENAINCYDMFTGCRSFNQPVAIPSKVADCSYMFLSCYNYNQPITIPISVTSVHMMFAYCNNMKSVVRLPNKFNNGMMRNFWPNCPVSVANGTLIFY